MLRGDEVETFRSDPRRVLPGPAARRAGRGARGGVNVSARGAGRGRGFAISPVCRYGLRFAQDTSHYADRRTLWPYTATGTLRLRAILGILLTSLVHCIIMENAILLVFARRHASTS